MIRSELDVLLDKVQDEDLRSALQAQIDRLRQRRSFGLVFEQHIPERVRLPQHPIRVGSHVVSRDDEDSPTWEVADIEEGDATLLPTRDRGGAQLPRGEHGADDRVRVPIESLVVISDFGEPVLPGFHFLGSVDRGGDKPYHVVINGENHHALEALRFTHAGKVDCIYIDPPYNSGARDWKYNNDYVDENDGYRHSKWLAFMERRLKLARQLLNPDKSILLVTIDEHELQRLRMLLDQTFPDAYIQVVTIVVNPKGVAQGRFARVEEYAIYCFFGTAGVIPTEDDYLSDSATLRNTRFWKGLLRAGTNARPSDGLGMAYPIYIDAEHSRITSVGRTVRQRIEAGEIVGDPDEWLPSDEPEAPPGTVTVWPLRADGKLGVWQAIPETLMGLVAEGLVRCVLRSEGWALSYVPSGVRTKIQTGEIAVTGRDASGSVVLVRLRDMTRAKTVWKRARHDAGWHGSVVLRALLGQRMFDFPKSLYAVRDALAPVIGDNRNAVVLDFFAGSGTTAHALALLNRADGGCRSSILVTNNEVGLSDAQALRRLGKRPGDTEWEAKGIFESVTRPRLTAAWRGLHPDGSSVDLEYDDGSSAADGLHENVAFLNLRYLDSDDVELGLSFDDLAPLLWLRAGAKGPIAGRLAEGGAPLPFVWTQSYGVLFEEDRWRRFVEARPESARTAFLLTHSPTAFAGIAAELPTGMSVVRIPESYLSMFLPDRGRA